VLVLVRVPLSGSEAMRVFKNTLNLGLSKVQGPQYSDTYRSDIHLFARSNCSHARNSLSFLQEWDYSSPAADSIWEVDEDILPLELPLGQSTSVTVVSPPSDMYSKRRARNCKYFTRTDR
jgi:hypothetical protein